MCRISAEVSANGWTLRSVTLSRACTATSYENFFLSQSARLSNFSSKYRGTQVDNTVTNQYNSKWSNVSLIHAKLQKLAGNCRVPFDLPLDGKWEPDFYGITALFQQRLSQTNEAYQQCLNNAEYYYQDIPCEEVFQSCCDGHRHYDKSYAYLQPEYYVGDVLPANNRKNTSSNFSCSNIVQPTRLDGEKISFACYIEAVANVTTPGFNLTVWVERYTR